jgi:hypothetical protein
MTSGHFPIAISTGIAFFRCALNVSLLARRTIKLSVPQEHRHGHTHMTGPRMVHTHSHTHTDRPCFDRGDGLANGRVLLHIDRAVDRSVPDRGLVRPVHHVDLNLNCSRQDSVAPVLGNGLQPIALALQDREKRKRNC